MRFKSQLMEIVELIGYVVVGISVVILVVAIFVVGVIVVSPSSGVSSGVIGGLGIASVIGITFGMVGFIAAGMILIATVRFLELADQWGSDHLRVSRKDDVGEKSKGDGET